MGGAVGGAKTRVDEKDVWRTMTRGLLRGSGGLTDAEIIFEVEGVRDSFRCLVCSLTKKDDFWGSSPTVMPLGRILGRIGASSCAGCVFSVAGLDDVADIKDVCRDRSFGKLTFMLPIERLLSGGGIQLKKKSLEQSENQL